MNNGLFKGKSTRTKIFTVITVLSIVLLLIGNLGLTYLGQERLLFADMTPEGFYTMTEKMEDACRTILKGIDKTDENGNKKNVVITFCSDPDKLIANLDTRYTYYLALTLRNMFDNVEVKTVNVLLNPTAVAQYRTTSRESISSTDIIFSYGGRYRIASASSFWTSNKFSYNGEYKMATILGSLTAINQPAAYFVTNHGETYYNPDEPKSEMSRATSDLFYLLTERGLSVKLLDLSDEGKIPEDCALLIINNPTKDFVTNPSDYNSFGKDSETEKINEYLVAHQGAVIINKDYKVDLPVLEVFVEEWGICFSDSLVKDMENSLPGVGEDGTAILGVYDENTLGGVYYNNYANLSSAPKMVFTNSGYVYSASPDSDSSQENGGYSSKRIYSDFIYTSDGAVAYVGADSAVVTGDASKKALAAVATRTELDGFSGETVYAYMFCTNTADFLSNDLLGNTSYANYDVTAAMIDNISRIDSYASLELGGTSANSPSFGGKQVLSTTMYDTINTIYGGDGKKLKENAALLAADKAVFTVIVTAVPVTVLVLGVACFIRRKFL